MKYIKSITAKWNSIVVGRFEEDTFEFSSRDFTWAKCTK